MRQIEVSREFLEEFEIAKKSFGSVYGAMWEIEQTGDLKLIDRYLFCNSTRKSDAENQNEFAEVWIGKAEYVAKKQLYHVKLINDKRGYLSVRKFKGTLLIGTKKEVGGYQTKFTEQEIKTIDERYWTFAVKGED